VAPILNSGADVLVLNHQGENMINSLTAAIGSGLKTAQANGKNFQIVVPLYTDLMAKGAGKNIAGIFGTAAWHWSLENKAASRYLGTNAFVKSFGEKYGFPPSQAAHTCYCQTLLYADAVQRGGSFNPCSVVEALEGFEFDGMGNGPTLYRAEDHQCIKDVLIMRGKENPANDFDLLELVDVAPAEAVTFDPKIFGRELGSCNLGA
jgi:ABC-type branched-subunit amino acid transport system substrate-binding protein